MSEKVCDHTSVGAIIKNERDEILLVERKKFPFGFAPPAGHIDDFGSPVAALKGEVEEEVGLATLSLTPLIEDMQLQYPCRRSGGTHHSWWVYEATVHGEIQMSEDETKGYRWCSMETLKQLAERTERYVAGEIDEESWQEKPGLDPVWVVLFREVTYI